MWRVDRCSWRRRCRGHRLRERRGGGPFPRRSGCLLGKWAGVAELVAGLRGRAEWYRSMCFGPALGGLRLGRGRRELVGLRRRSGRSILALSGSGLCWKMWFLVLRRWWAVLEKGSSRDRVSGRRLPSSRRRLNRCPSHLPVLVRVVAQ